MALINIDTALNHLASRLQRLPVGHGLEILSYKRNRSVLVIREPEDIVLIRERGHREEEWRIPFRALPSQLKSIIKVEFPRSRKVRVYHHAGPATMDRELKKL